MEGAGNNRKCEVVRVAQPAPSPLRAFDALGHVQAAKILAQHLDALGEQRLGEGHELAVRRLGQHDGRLLAVVPQPDGLGLELDDPTKHDKTRERPSHRHRNWNSLIFSEFRVTVGVTVRDGVTV